MRTILVDDDIVSREFLSKILREMKQVSLLKQFETAEDALAYASTETVDLAILDIGLPKMDGMMLAEKLLECNPRMLLIFETSAQEYALEAFRLKAVSYIMKPYCKEEVEYALESAYLLSKRSAEKSAFFIRTFGHFDLFIEGSPVAFKSAKAKELLALLVDRRGGILTSEQMIASLWENRPNDEATQNLASKLTRSLCQELERVHAQDIIHVDRGVRNLNVDKVSCDFYDFLNGDAEAVRQYYGEYMSDYTWGEYRIAMLDRIWKKTKI